MIDDIEFYLSIVSIIISIVLGLSTLYFKLKKAIEEMVENIVEKKIDQIEDRMTRLEGEVEVIKDIVVKNDKSNHQQTSCTKS